MCKLEHSRTIQKIILETRFVAPPCPHFLTILHHDHIDGHTHHHNLPYTCSKSKPGHTAKAGHRYKPQVWVTYPWILAVAKAISTSPGKIDVGIPLPGSGTCIFGVYPYVTRHLPRHPCTHIPCTNTHVSAPCMHVHNQLHTPLPSNMHPSVCIMNFRLLLHHCTGSMSYHALAPCPTMHICHMS